MPGCFRKTPNNHINPVHFSFAPESSPTTTIGLYLHFPFCRQKCTYCDFASRPGREEEFLPYVQGLLAELRLHGGLLQEVEVTSVYLGGGTPSLLPAGLLSLLLRQVIPDRGKGVAEVTMEANPESIDRRKLEAFAASGGNRLSLGLQTHDDRLLRLLGRLHTAEEAAGAVRLARAAGIARINLDLIYGLPGQTVSGWEETLSFALALEPDHLSLYALELHPGTPLAEAAAGGGASLPAEEEAAEMAVRAMEILPRAGYRRYEIASFARPGAECRHNLNYWRRGRYLGLGAAAHSFLGNERRANHKTPGTYLAALARGEAPAAFAEKVGPAEAILETIMLGLRLEEGVPLSRFASGLPAEHPFMGTMEGLAAEGLLSVEGGRFRLTDRGVLFAGYVLRTMAGALPDGAGAP